MNLSDALKCMWKSHPGPTENIAHALINVWALINSFSFHKLLSSCLSNNACELGFISKLLQ